MKDTPRDTPVAYFLPMRRLALSSSALSSFSSTGVTLRPLARAEQQTEGFGVDVVEFAARSRIGRHPTRLWQLLAVVSGEGWAAGPDGHAVPLRPGEAVLWEPGEEHASGSSGGMVAVIVQSPVSPVPPAEELPAPVE